MRRSLEEGERRGRETGQEAVAIIQANDDGGLDQDGAEDAGRIQFRPCSNDGDRQWLAHKYILEVELIDVLKDRSIRHEFLKGSKWFKNTKTYPGESQDKTPSKLVCGINTGG